MSSLKINGHTAAALVYGKPSPVAIALAAGGNGRAKRLPVQAELPLCEKPITPSQVELHPLVTLFPTLPELELFQLAEDIRRAGSTTPFLISVDWRESHKSKGCWFLVDDRNRYAACLLAKVTVEFAKFDSSDSLPETVARLNMPRAHLSESQRAAIAVPFVEKLSAENFKRRTDGLLRGKDSRRNNSGIASETAITENPSVSVQIRSREKTEYAKTSEAVALRFGTSASYIEKAKRLRDDSRDLYIEVLAGCLTITEARLKLSQATQLKKLNDAADRLPAARRKVLADCITTGDCLEEMPKLPGGKFRLIHWDGPYNNGTEYDADPDHDRLSDDEFLDRSKRCMQECARLLTPDGSLFVMIDARYCGRFDAMLRELKDPPLHWRNMIVWWEDFPQYRDVNYVKTARFIHYFTRHEKNFVWNKEDILEPSARTLVYNEPRRVRDGRVPDNVWVYNRVSNNDEDRVRFDKAPPQLPADLLQRLIKCASNPGDTVFDPMCGTATFGKEALSLGREFKGIERSPLYAKQARQWINSAEINHDGAKSAKVRGGKS